VGQLDRTPTGDGEHITVAASCESQAHDRQQQPANEAPEGEAARGGGSEDSAGLLV
jgi:hypothetical protein